MIEQNLNLKKGLTVVLPIKNEAENLKWLIPELFEVSRENNLLNFNVIVVDDSSTDSIAEVASQFSSLYKSNFVLETRSGVPSLPKSIELGVRSATTDFVAWLDADGSMPVSVLVSMYKKVLTENLDFVVGSRFVEGGGIKGINLVGRTSVWDFMRNVRKSEDSLPAVFGSRVLNIALRLLLPIGIKDMTSGFVVVKSSMIRSVSFLGHYGDYCPIIFAKLCSISQNWVEFGYISPPRKFGTSKTGSSFVKLLLKGFPYIIIAIRHMRIARPYLRKL